MTGGAGRVGRSVTEHLAECGHDVLAVDRIAPPLVRAGSAVVDLIDIRDLERAFRHVDAVVHMARVPFPYASAGYDAATRTWHKPDLVEDMERFNLNLAMTYNVLGAALAVGAKKLVMGSSLAVYGFYYPSRPAFPDYLPIDETHPLRPDDHYGLSKRLGEALADGFASKHTMGVISLRFPVIFEGDQSKLLAQQTTAIRGFGAFGTYLDVRDAARACRLALETELSGHEAFNVCAPTTLMKQSTIDLARAFFPEISDIRRADAGNWSGYDPGKARNILGFEAEHLVTL
ncbi:MAG TPA: NAD(P)-dependent oxidoreductase [Xanthobacteraceae bacterium]